MGHLEAAIALANQISSRSCDNGFEAISIRAENLFCRLLAAVGQNVPQERLKIPERRVQSSRYWLEVMEAWVYLGENYVAQAKGQADYKTGISYLLRVSLDCALCRPPVVKTLMDRARRSLLRFGDDTDILVQPFQDDEPDILNEAYIVLMNLNDDLRRISNKYV